MLLNKLHSRDGSSPKPPKILVVDDQPINLKLLQRKLERQGMDVLLANDGRECIEIVERELPDLILLDVMMPEMDGIETCAHLKSNPRTETIPVIFVTAKTSREGKLEGLEAGAVDYITKPIDLDETVARVNTQLRLQDMFRENLQLQRRLEESRRTAAVGAITEGIAHNLNNLLGVVVGYLDLMKVGLDNPATVKRSVGLMDNAIQRMVHIIRQLSKITADERLEMTPVNLRDLIGGAIERFKREQNLEDEIRMTSTVPADFKFSTNLEVFESVIAAVLQNAWESYPKNHQGQRPITLDSQIIPGEYRRTLRLSVFDDGTGIDPEVEENLYEPFVTTKTSVGRGMGLTIARHALRNLGADITVKNREPKGAVAEINFYL